MSVLESLTDEQKQKAFEKARDEANFTEGKLVRVTEEYYRAALDFARDCFVADEPVIGNAGVVWGPNVEEGWKNVFEFGLSIMLINEQTGEENPEVIAFRVTHMHVTGNDPYGLDEIADAGTRRVWAYVAYCDERAKVLEHFGVKEALHLVGLAVNQKYRQRGIARKIMQTALNMYKYLGIDRLCIKGEASSNFSKKVYAKTGFTYFYEKPFDEYIIDGEQVFKNTGIHKSLASYGQMIYAEK